MTRKLKTVLIVGVAAFAATAASAAFAADPVKKTPPGWSYDIKDGQRVPKAERVSNPDGSWREESRKGACVETKEKSASGEIKITRKCD